MQTNILQGTLDPPLHTGTVHNFYSDCLARQANAYSKIIFREGISIFNRKNPGASTSVKLVNQPVEQRS